MVRLLLLHRATIDDRDVRGNTPLNYATEFGQTNVIKLLLENGAEVNAVNNEGLSPLFQVVQNNPYRLGTPQRLALIDFLLANKAQVNVTNLFGTTLFQAALRAGNTEVINRLRQQGAKE